MFERKSIVSPAIPAAVILFAASMSWGAITATLPTSGFYQTAGGVNIPAGTMLQIVNLGANGVFDPIDIGDGSTDKLTTQWVSGDDSVMTAIFEDGSPDFTSLAAFDLTKGADTAGIVNRSFTFTAPAGTKFGIRWFPGLQPGNYYLPGGGITLAVNQPYGQFTRQNDPAVSGPLYDGPLNGLNNWVYTTDGDSFSLDPMITAATGAPNAHDANSTGLASLSVIQTPEPSTAALAFMSAVGLFSLRRRRS